MKRNENKKTNRNRSLVVLLVVAVFASVVAGCNEPVAEPPTPEFSASEVLSEVVSEEVFEPVCEEPSEVVSEEVVEETMDLTPYTTENGKKIMDLINDMNYDELKVVIWRRDEGAKAILSNGDSYEIQEGDSLHVYYPKEMSGIKANIDNIDITERGSAASFILTSFGENMEVIFTITDEDGKEYEITVYLTEKLPE